MKTSNTLALIVAFYLSKFNELAYKNLNFGNFTQTHKKIGEILEIKPATLKNMRDEFDPYHENDRSGWHQRPLRPSRRIVLETYQSLEEEELRDLVTEILSTDQNTNSFELKSIAEDIQHNEKKEPRAFIVRGITGKRAEEFFINYHNSHKLPQSGTLLDTRDNGCGYDFEILNSESRIFIEVKGLEKNTGGVSFTSKEWDMAQKHGDNYYLAVVKNISESPHITIIRNPASKLAPKKNIIRTIQIIWNISTI